MEEIGKSRLLKILLTMTVALSLVGSALQYNERRQASWRPPFNVLLITVDCLRADHVYPDSEINLTPRIYELEKQGTRFKTVYAQSDVTSPCTVAMLTSRFISQLHAKADPLGATPVSIAEILKREGYQTGAFISSVGLYGEPKVQDGFDTYEYPDFTENGGLGTRSGQRTTDLACKWLSRMGTDERWFAWVMYWDLHWPQLRHTGYGPKPNQTKDAEMLQAYDETVAYNDACVGRLMDQLKTLEMAENTLVVVTANHAVGQAGGSKNWRNYAGLYEEIVRVPLVLWLPGKVKAGVTIEEPVMHVDLVPTVLAILGLPPIPSPGVDLLAGVPGYRDIYMESRDLESRAIRRGKWKYVEYLENLDLPIGSHTCPGLPDPKRKGWMIYRPAGLQELFDLSVDPAEKKNLGSEHREVAGFLRSRLAKWQAANGAVARKTTPLDPKLVEALRKHGYLP